MKIGIITFSDFNTNYGSRLQAYSLSRFLIEEGHDVEFIRYREFNKPPKIRSIKVLISKYAAKTLKVLNRKTVKLTEMAFEEFSEKYLKHTELYTSNEELKDKLEVYDCYICGSDQIWNLDCLGGLRLPYFLDFVPQGKLRIAYAPSFGDYKIEEDKKEIISKLINEFDRISVRETSGVEMLSRYTKKSIEHVLDPAFLTSKEEWEKVIPKIYEKEDYGICYLVRRSKECNKIINHIKQKENIRIFNLSDNCIRIKNTSEKYITVDPLKFLALIKGAKFTIGTSFHLAVFSIIFNVPFIIIGMESNESRLRSLLAVLGCEDRLVVLPKDKDKINDIIHKIDAENINNKLQEEIIRSKEYLTEALKIKK